MLAPDSIFGSATGSGGVFSNMLSVQSREERERTGQHTDNTQQDLLDALHWTPALVRRLVRIGIISWCVQDGDTDIA